MSAVFSPSVSMIIRQSLQLAGLLPMGREPSAIEKRHARDIFDVTLKSLSSRGATLDQMVRQTYTLGPPSSGSVSSLVLDADTIEVDFPMTIKVAGQTSETYIQHIVFDEYQSLSNKLASGTPTSCYVEKQSNVTLYFWPVPVLTYALSLRRQRLIADSSDGSSPDIRARWHKALVYSLAHDMILAGSLPTGQAQYMKSLADEHIGYALGRENEGGDIMFTLPTL